ncbi:MAG TPA: hypothetical protein ENJ64_03000 [Thiotrichales bacterium]|nr:hypothetical protein [Thiotrichales bacterium]
MTAFFRVALLVFLPVAGAAGAERINYASLSAGVDNDNGSLFNAYGDFSLTQALRINFSVGQNTARSEDETFSTKQYQLAIAGHHEQAGGRAITWSLGYQAWGKTETIESQDSRISLGYFFNPNWHASMDYEKGSLEVFIKPRFSRRQTSLASDRKAWRLTTGYTGDSGSGWVSYLQRDYEKNLPAINRRPLLQRAIKSIALSQAYALSKEELTLGYEWFFDNMDLGLDYNRITLVVDSGRNHYASIYARFYPGQSMTVDVRLEQEVNANFNVLIAGIGFVW